MSIDNSSESLRRSKRNKFHLDVAGICSNSGRRSANSHLEREYDDSASPQPPTLSPQMGELHDSESDDDGDGKKRTPRHRKVAPSSDFALKLSDKTIPQRIASCYTHDGSSDEDDSFLISGPIGCGLCPMRFGSRSGLSNHMRMHGGADKNRLYKCDKCDFSCGTNKASRLHCRSHELVPDFIPNAETNSLPVEEMNIHPTVGVKRQADGTIVQREKQTSPSQMQEPESSSNETVATSSLKSKNFSGGLRFVQNQGKSLPAAKITLPKSGNRILIPNNKIGVNRQNSSNTVRNLMLSMQETPPQTTVGAALKSHFGLNKNRLSLPANLDVMDGAAVSRKVEEGKDKRRYKCQLCPFTSHVNQRFQQHKDAHNKTTGPGCPHCTYRSDMAGQLKRHIALHEAWSEKSENDQNAEDAVGDEEIEQHDEAYLNDPTGFRKALLIPRTGIQLSNGVIQCPVPDCEFGTRFSNDLVRHKRFYHGIKFHQKHGFECAMCAIKYPTWGQRAVHLKMARHHKPHFTQKLVRRFLREIIGSKLYKADASQLVQMQLKCEVEESPVENDVKVDLENRKVELMEADMAKKVLESSVVKQEEAKDALPATQSSIDDPLRCTQCPYIASSRSRLKRHENKHIIKSENQCPHCTFSCRGEDLLSTHIRLHIAETNYKDGINDDFGPTLQIGNIALASVNESPESTDAAQNVKKEESVQEEETQATEQAVSTPIPELEREESSQDATSSKKLRFIDKDGIRRERCPECPYTTKHFCDMKAHRTMHGGVRREHACPYCSYSTKRFMSLRTHVRLHGKKIKDPMDRLAVCKEIDIIHPVYGMLGIRRTGIGATKQRRYICVNCPFIAHYCSQLWQHARRHCCPSPGATQCSSCNYASIDLERLESHESLHPPPQKENKEVPAPNSTITNGNLFKCSDCPFITDTYGRLWNHKEKHKKPSKFPCDHCSFSTGSLTSLHQHTQLHGSQKFECRIPGCNHNEANYEDIQKHYETVHTTSASLRRRPLLADICMERATNGTGVDDEASNQSGKSSRSPQDSYDGSRKRVSQSPPDLGLPFSIPDPALVVKIMRETLPPWLNSLKESRSGSSSLLSSFNSSSAMMRCSDPDCPYEDDDPTLYRLHADMHGTGKRPFSCSICTYSCFAPEALYNHLDLHIEGHDSIKKITSASSRRLAREAEIFVDGAAIYACTHCNYRTQSVDRLKQHRAEHALSQQNRMKTSLKRGGAQEDWSKPQLRPTARKNDKEHYCLKCGFHCISLLSYERHVQMHGTAGYFICKLCDYSSNTYNVVHFHEINHHLDQPLSHLTKAATLDPESSKLSVPPPTTEDRIRLAGQEVRCNRCDWKGIEMSALSAHFSAEHADTPEDKKEALYLYFGLTPKTSILPASA